MFYLPQSAFAGRATRQISQTLLTINLHIKTILLLFLFILLNHSAYHSTGLLTTILIKRRGLIVYQSHIKTDFSTPCTTENLLQVSKNNQHSYVLIRVGGWGAVECLSDSKLVYFQEHVSVIHLNPHPSNQLSSTVVEE